MEIIEKALHRFKELIESLDCECDPYQGFTCSLHNDLKLANAALREKREGKNCTSLTQ